MLMKTNLSGRVKNTALPKSNGLFPLYEAIVNSIHAIDDRFQNDMNQANITVSVLRGSDQPDLFSEEKQSEIVGFEISDNGIGFNEANFLSFNLLDSDYKLAKGCKGTGRLLWLKAFSHIEINSVFQGVDQSLHHRHFKFDIKEGIKDHRIEATTRAVKTTVKLDGIHKIYAPSIPKTLDTLATYIFEHCLWYFMREGGAPEITLIDGDEIKALTPLYDALIPELETDTFTLEAADHHQAHFTITHIKLRRITKEHSIGLCANNRLVQEKTLKIPALHGKLSDPQGEFIYVCHVASPYLDDHVRAERMEFDFPKEGELYIKENQIIEAITQKATVFLEHYLENNKMKGLARVTKYIAENSPRYQPILFKLADETRYIDPDIKNTELELKLYKELYKLELEMQSAAAHLMTSKTHKSPADYRHALENYCDTAHIIQRADLTNYVTHRRTLCDIYEKHTEGRSKAYPKEALVCALLMPGYLAQPKIRETDLNLWLIDEQLVFHRHVTTHPTDKPFPSSNTLSEGLPRLLDQPLLMSAHTHQPTPLVVIEIKSTRSEAGDADHDPINACLVYITDLRSRQSIETTERSMNTATLPAFCYILAEFTDTLIAQCQQWQLSKLEGAMHYFGYDAASNTHIKVIAFDALFNNAAQRNQAFFMQ